MNRRTAFLLSLSGILVSCSRITAETSTQRHLENKSPATNVGYVLNTNPTLSILVSDASDETSVNVVGARLLRDGGVVIADAATSRIRFYSRGGMLERVLDFKPGNQSSRIRFTGLQRVHGDSMALLAGSAGWLILPNGDTVNSFRLINGQTTLGRTPFLLAIFKDASALWSLVGPPPPLPPGTWTDSVKTLYVPRGGTPVSFRTLPAREFISRGPSNSPQQLWFHPQLVLGALGEDLYYGFGAEYRVTRVRPRTGAEMQIRRAWTPVPVSRADFEEFVKGWSVYWNQEADSVEVKAQMLASAYSEFVPAFSQFLISPTGELWVRSPNLTDAEGNGELDTVPLTTSVWSVFDYDGRWVSDVTLPARFLPTDVGRNYLLGVQYGSTATSRLGRERSVSLFSFTRR